MPNKTKRAPLLLTDKEKEERGGPIYSDSFFRFLSVSEFNLHAD